MPAEELLIMMIGERLRSLREEKNFSQGVIENRTGLLRAYVSRVENGHTVPAIETLEKFARALEVPIYQLFYGVGEHPEIPLSARREDPKLWGNSGKELRMLAKFLRHLERLTEDQRKLLLHTAQKMSKSSRKAKK
jgi:transcriptional regulator with XRE-family HTH domain